MVNRRSTSTTHEPVLQLQRQLEDFPEQSVRAGEVTRFTLAGGSRVGTAIRHLAGRASFTTGLYEFKETLGQGPATAWPQSRSPVFHRMVAARPAVLEACVIELESPRGAKMRIHWKATTPPDWTNLLQAWRET
jgi:hypothetical protein